jgi:hypothetical protein
MTEEKVADLESEIKLLKLQNDHLQTENSNLKQDSLKMVELLAKMDTLLQKSNRTIKNLEDKLEQNSVVVKSEQMETNCTALAIAEDILNNANMMANNANIVTPNGLHTGVHTSTVTSSLTDLLTNNVTDVGLNGGLLNGSNPDMGFLEIQSLKKLEQAKKEEEIKRDENGLFLCPHCDTRLGSLVIFFKFYHCHESFFGTSWPTNRYRMARIRWHILC